MNIYKHFLYTPEIMSFQGGDACIRSLPVVEMVVQAYIAVS